MNANVLRAVCIAVVVPTAAQAATFTVTTLSDEVADDAVLSLREAVAAANAAPDTDTIVLPAGTFPLASVLLSTTSVDVVGAGRELTVLDGQGANAIWSAQGPATSFRALQMKDSLALDAALISSTSLTVSDCAFRNNTNNDAGSGTGGAINLSGTAVIADSVFEDNDAHNGGAIGGSNVALTVVRSTFSDNTANDGGALFLLGAPAAVVSDSTFDGNDAAADGGAILTVAPLHVVNSTFSANTGGDEGGAINCDAADVDSSTFSANVAVSGGSIFSRGPADVRLKNTIAANDTPDDGGGGRDLVSLGFNLIEATGVFLGLPSDVLGIDPQLGALAQNGGATQTLRLPGASPAVDAGSCNDIAGVAFDLDQRGRFRADERCDIGSFELGGISAPVAARVRTEGPGANCAAGGQAIDTGADDGDGDGTAFDGLLDDDEVDDTVFVCDGTNGSNGTNGTNGSNGSNGTNGSNGSNGADGDDGAPGVDGDDGAPGVDGADGAPGVDGDDGATGPAGDDGAPGDDGEDGATGPAGETGPPGPTGASGSAGGSGLTSLLRLTPIEAGDDCLAGGQVVESGLDDGAGGGTGGNGILEDGEVDSTAVVCNGEAFQDEFETTGGPTCASGNTSSALVSFALLAGLLRRRRRS